MHALRHIVRSLLKAPAFTSVAVVTLALGIGVNSTLYSVINTLVFSNAPFPERKQLFSLDPQVGERQIRQDGLSYAEIQDLQANVSTVEHLVPYRLGLATWSDGSQAPEQIMTTALPANAVAALAVPPVLGRDFTPEECESGQASVALLSHDLWKTRFGGSPEVLGRPLRLNGQTLTIVGILPENYSYRFLFFETEVFLPLTFSPEQRLDRSRKEFSVIGRVKRDSSITQLNAQLADVATRWTTAEPHRYANYSLSAVQLGRRSNDGLDISFYLLAGIGLAILFIACSNLANLQLARASHRVRELAIRSALGATRIHLVQIQLLEAFILSLAGGAAGLLLASWLNDLIGQNLLVGTKTTLPISIDGRVIVFTAVATVVTAFGFGLLPAWLSSRVDINQTLKNQTRGNTTSRFAKMLKSNLVVMQIAFSLALLSLAVGMVQSIQSQMSRATTWDASKVLFANLEISDKNYPTEESKRTFQRTLHERLRSIPGVQDATVSNNLPNLIYGGGRPETVLHERLDASRSDLPLARRFLIGDGYFSTLGVTVLEGRVFDATAKESDPAYTVISEGLAKAFWPGESAVGKRLGSRQPDGFVVWREVIGVVRAVEDPAFLFQAPQPLQYYTLFAKEPWGWFQVALRDNQPARLKAELNNVVTQLDPTVSPKLVYDLAELKRIFMQNVYVINAILFGVALLGLVLAAVGLFGIISNQVESRMSEFGIRLALGAQPTDLLLMVMKHGAKLTGLGIITGLIINAVLSAGIEAQFPDLGAGSLWTEIVTAILIASIASFATWLPARRATTADPMVALRSE